MKNLISYFMAGLVIIVILFISGFAIGSVGIIPGNAIVYVDEKTNIYYSPIGLTQDKVTKQHLKKSTLKEVDILGFKMNEEDRQNGYYQQDGRSLSGSILEKLGVLPKLNSRIDTQGNWRY